MKMNRQDPSAYELNYVTANRFYVEIDSQISACFSECSGLGINIKRETYNEGGVNDQQRIILGQAEFTEVTLKRGITNDLTFLNWIEKVLREPQKIRLNVTLLLFNQEGETMQSWTLIGSVPVGWKAPSFQADSNTVAIEELTLAYEGLTINKGGSLGQQTGGFNPSSPLTRGNSGYFASDLTNVGTKPFNQASQTNSNTKKKRR
ncbi:MAG: phage tail protein [Limnoraphis robusta]